MVGGLISDVRRDWFGRGGQAEFAPDSARFRDQPVAVCGSLTATTLRRPAREISPWVMRHQLRVRWVRVTPLGKAVRSATSKTVGSKAPSKTGTPAPATTG